MSIEFPHKWIRVKLQKHFLAFMCIKCEDKVEQDGLKEANDQPCQYETYRKENRLK